jgi:hypothetical protein
VDEDRLSEGFRDKLLTWRHQGGFSVYGRHLILNEEPARLAHMARYVVRAPAALDRVTATDNGRVLLEIPGDPRTGATTLVLEPLEWVRRITNQVPAPKAHMVRYYGAYANRSRKLYRAEDGEVRVQVVDPEPVSASQASWARLLRQVFEVDPLACPRCSAEMRIVSMITTPAVIDQILRHVRTTGKDDLWGARAPPAA